MCRASGRDGEGNYRGGANDSGDDDFDEAMEDDHQAVHDEDENQEGSDEGEGDDLIDGMEQ